MDERRTAPEGGRIGSGEGPAPSIGDDAAATDDRRPETRYVRSFAGDEGDGMVILVGVVHDHPASVARVQHVVEAATPDVLAVELPPLAVPLYEAHADDGGAPPALGGEISAAVAAAATDDVVGIDGPSPGFVRTYLRRLARERPSPGVVSRSLRLLLSVTGRAITCWLAAWVTRLTALRVGVGSVTSHGTSWTDPADERAADERSVLRSAVAVDDAFEPPPSSRYCSESRERHMADRLAVARTRGDVVAVVGASHFDPLSAALGPGDDPE